MWLAILVGIAATAVVLRNRGGEDLFRVEQAPFARCTERDSA